MLSRLLGTFVVIGLFSGLSYGIPNRPEKLATQETKAEKIDVDHFAENYYLHKDGEKLIAYLKYVDEQKILDDSPGAVDPTIGFLTGIFAEESTATRLASCQPYAGKMKEAVQQALWMSGHGAAIQNIFGETPEFAKQKPTTLATFAIKTAGDLDKLWGAFMGSGEVSHVRRIIDVLDERVALSGNEKEDLVIRAAASWSLESNMQQHELVHRLIAKESKSRKGAVQDKLREMLKSIPSTNLGKKDGDFTAMLVVMDAKHSDEFRKPEDEGVKLRQKSKAKPEDVVHIMIMFTGQDLTEDLNSDVRYNLRVLDPDGNVYCGMDNKNLEGVVGRIRTRFSFYNNRQVVAIAFEPKDKRGIYKIHAEVFDKVGNKSLELDQQIELTD